MKANVFVRLLLVVFFLCLPLLGITGCSGSGAEKVSKKYTLAPKSTRRISFELDKETTFNFHTNFSSEQIARCENGGVRVMFRDRTGAGERVTSTSGGHLKVHPDRGTVSLTLENLEAFPIKLAVSWRK